MHLKDFFYKINTTFLGVIRYIILYISLFTFVLLYKYYYIAIQPIKISLFLLECIITYIIIMFFTTLFHELGHMIFGLFTNYKFCSVQLFDFILFSLNDHLILKKLPRYTIKAQCIMIPSFKSNYIPPYILYNLGGVFFNIIQIILSFTCLSLNPTPYFSFLLHHLYINSLFSIIFNLLPSNTFNSMNDGNIVISLLKNDITKQDYYWHLQFYKDLQNGIEPKTLLNSAYFIDCKPNIKNPFGFYNQFIKYYAYLDNRNFLLAKDTLTQLWKNINFFSKEEQIQLRAEYTFIQIIINYGDHSYKLDQSIISQLQDIPLPYAHRILITHYSLSGETQQSEKCFFNLKNLLNHSYFLSLSTMEYQLSYDILNKNILEKE